MTVPEPRTPLQAGIPVLRSFDEARAREFYIDFLGFEVEFEHRFAEGLPLYLSLFRGALRLHVSEHHGDACPGSTVFIPVTPLEPWRDELLAKPYTYARPAISEQGWGKMMELTDPFGNRLRFCEV